MQTKQKTKHTICGVSEAARALSVSADWLREGEKRGLLPPARREGGRRRYTQADIERLRRLGVGERKRRLAESNV